MSWTALPGWLASLALQLVLFQVVVERLSLWIDDARHAVRLWTLFFVGVLGLALVGVLLPHYRFGGPWGDVVGLTAARIAIWQGRIGVVLGLTWGVGALLTGGWHIRRGRLLFRLLRTFCRELTPTERSLLQGVDYRFEEGTRLLTSDVVPGPFCLQFHRPYVVLPSSLLLAHPQSLQHVLEHELEHLRTAHPLQLFFQQACQSLFWFHPSIHRAARYAELARECHCDEVAAGSSKSLADYLRTLLNLAEDSQFKTCVLSFAHYSRPLAERTRYLLRRQQQGALTTPRSRFRLRTAYVAAVATILASSQLWLPLDVLASQTAGWSPWPHVTARVMHDFGVSLRDFEVYDGQRQYYRAALSE
ncbi:MAG: M56 family metallopeptidase [Planctomycetales bacterium]|nr:M56 family metallopeptidase [Planctomycetales bacterium]